MREVEAMLEATRAAKERGDVPAAIESAEKALAIADAFETPSLVYRAHHELGVLYARPGGLLDLQRAQSHFEQALDLARRADTPLLVSRSARQLGTIHLMQGRGEDAEAVLVTACDAARDLDDEPADRAACWLLLAECLAGDPSRADDVRSAMAEVQAPLAELTGPAAAEAQARLAELEQRMG